MIEKIIAIIRIAIKIPSLILLAVLDEVTKAACPRNMHLIMSTNICLKS